MSLRHWVARCQYEGREPFLLGTVQAETELQALRALEELWKGLSPHPCPVKSVLPGLLAFVPEGD